MMRRPILTHALTALLALAAGSASAQFSTPMRDVENSDRSPFMLNASGSIEAPFANGFLFFPTPTGRRYFIDYVSLTCTTPNAGDTLTQVLLGVRQNTANGTVANTMPAIAMERRGAAPISGTLWSGAANVKMFSDPDQNTAGGGTNISMNVFHTDTSSRAQCSAFIYGHTLAP